MQFEEFFEFFSWLEQHLGQFYVTRRNLPEFLLELNLHCVQVTEKKIK